MASQRGQEMFPSGQVKDSLFRSARTRETWLLVAIYFTTFGGFLAMTSWLPVYWKSFFAVPAVTAGALTAVYSILASLCRVGGGSISDRLGGVPTLLLALGITGIGAVLMTLSRQSGLSVGAEILMAAGMGVSNAAVFKLVPQAVPQAVGGASGWVGGLGAFGGFTIPPVLGAIVAAQGPDGYASGFGIFIFLALLSLALAASFKLPALAGRGARPAV
jgi:NNP family nitrate/nitrite transporter-like MFS transporter